VKTHSQFEVNNNNNNANKGISTRPGALWHALPQDEKRRYEDRAKKTDAEHKRQYPGKIYYNNMARIKNAIRAEARNQKSKRRNTTSLSNISNTDIFPTAGQGKGNRLLQTKGRTIRRLPNAYILFTTKRRRHVAAEYPEDKNQWISTCLVGPVACTAAGSEAKI
jgi:hypothetical protein